MSDKDTASELEKLRAEVSALSDARREADVRSEAAVQPTEPESPAAEKIGVATDADEVAEETKSQLDELASLLEHEIRDLPTITCLAVFSLGILMGRLMR